MAMEFSCFFYTPELGLETIMAEVWVGFIIAIDRCDDNSKWAIIKYCHFFSSPLFIVILPLDAMCKLLIELLNKP
jgi:hypothetical protein